MEQRLVEPKTLIDDLLAQQKSLTAVERFARVHEADAIPAQARYYRDLIPLRAPAPGEQYAFEVDLDQCSGCKACVTACHALNGLDDEETWREVGLLHGERDGAAFQRTVTTACHHCIDPGCLEGCPTLAYEKDAATGIVKHLDDQCIGCQGNCILKCPYDVPKYSKARGIVRKCDMCSSRLAAGEAPACVQACPNEAIRIAVVNADQVARAYTSAMENRFLPDTPAPNYTRPATQYRSAEPLHRLNLRGADHAEIKPAQAHPPLVLFLVPTQMSVGALALAPFAQNARPVAAVGLAAGLLGLAASVLHLGRPMNAWRSFLGLRRSWLSREILAFGIFAPLAMAYTFLLWLPGISLPRLQQEVLPMTVSLAGICGVLCSVMVYHDTRRDFWRWPLATNQFAGTAAILGFATMQALSPTPIAAMCLILCSALKLLAELSFLKHLRGGDLDQLKRSALLLVGALRGDFVMRLITLAAGGVLLPLLLPEAGLVSLFLCLASELMERHLFFVAVAPDKMPGRPR